MTMNDTVASSSQRTFIIVLQSSLLQIIQQLILPKYSVYKIVNERIPQDRVTRFPKLNRPKFWYSKSLCKTYKQHYDPIYPKMILYMFFRLLLTCSTNVASHLSSIQLPAESNKPKRSVSRTKSNKAHRAVYSFRHYIIIQSRLWHPIFSARAVRKTYPDVMLTSRLGYSMLRSP